MRSLKILDDEKVLPVKLPKIARQLVPVRLNFEDHSTQRNLSLKLDGLKITSPGHSMDLQGICKAKKALKGMPRSVQLSLGN
jgi:hypothetical protein